MMRSSIAVAVTLGCLSFSAASEACPSRLGTTSAAVSDVIAAYKSQTVGMCVGAISHGVVAKQCAGTTDGIPGHKPTSSSLFLIDSITKTMTATLLALRNADPTSPIALHRPINDFMPAQSQVPTSISFLSLATHHSGLPRKFQVEDAAFQDFAEQVSNCTQNASCWDASMPFFYSNAAFDLLGDLLANADGQPGWAADNFQTLMLPLGMNATMTKFQYSADFPVWFANHAVTGWSFVGAGPQLVTNAPFDPPPDHSASGALYSSLDDQVTWLDYNLGNVGPAALRNVLPALRTPWDTRSATSDIGLAWNVEDDSCEPAGLHYSKDGAGSGFNSYVVYDHHTQRGVVVLLNVDGDVLDADQIALRAFHELP